MLSLLVSAISAFYATNDSEFKGVAERLVPSWTTSIIKSARRVGHKSKAKYYSLPHLVTLVLACASLPQELGRVPEMLLPMLTSKTLSCNTARKLTM